MGAWTSLGIVLLVAWFGSAADEQLSLKRRIRQDILQGTDTPIGACKIKNVGKHPWIIRFKFDLDPKLTLPQKLYTQYLQDSESYMGTLMTGTLISPTRVFTTLSWSGLIHETLAWYGGYLPNDFLLMYGYNYEDNCSQRRHVYQVIWHPRSYKFNAPLGNLGPFGLYTPYGAFEVDGEPYLFQAGQPHPIEKIDQTIADLLAKPDSLFMYLFMNFNGTDSTLFDEGGSSFTFIGLPTCKELPNFKLQRRVHFDPEGTNRSFFCGNGIPGTWNDSNNLTFEGRGGQDGASGAVVFYKDKTNGTTMPVGLYDYWIGANGEPRFFSTLTKYFFEWIDVADFPPTYKPSTFVPTTTTEGYATTPAPKPPPSPCTPYVPRTPTGHTSATRRYSAEFWIVALAFLVSM